MQYLKDEVRNNIAEEALKEFKILGYKGASIRSIAKNANTSVGNFYKYYTSKDMLFENIICSVYHKLMDYINQFEKVVLDDNAEYIFYELMEKIIEIFQESSIEIAVLFNKSDGSKYEDCKSVFVDFITRIVTETMKFKLLKQGKKLKDSLIIYLISCSVVESISIIVRETEDGLEVRKLLLNIVDFFYTDMENKLECDEIE